MFGIDLRLLVVIFVDVFGIVIMWDLVIVIKVGGVLGDELELWIKSLKLKEILFLGNMIILCNVVDCYRNY